MRRFSVILCLMTMASPSFATVMPPPPPFLHACLAFAGDSAQLLLDSRIALQRALKIRQPDRTSPSFKVELFSRDERQADKNRMRLATVLKLIASITGERIGGQVLSLSGRGSCAAEEVYLRLLMPGVSDLKCYNDRRQCWLQSDGGEWTIKEDLEQGGWLPKWHRPPIVDAQGWSWEEDAWRMPELQPPAPS